MGAEQKVKSGLFIKYKRIKTYLISFKNSWKFVVR